VASIKAACLDNGGYVGGILDVAGIATTRLFYLFTGAGKGHQ